MNALAEKVTELQSHGIEKLRRAVKRCHCRESFNQRWDEAQLLKIVEVHCASNWTILPDEWSDEQLSAALVFGEEPVFCERCEDPLPAQSRRVSESQLCDECDNIEEDCHG